MISLLKWVEIERGKDFKGEDHLKGDIQYLSLLEQAILDYDLLIEYLNANPDFCTGGVTILWN